MRRRVISMTPKKRQSMQWTSQSSISRSRPRKRFGCLVLKSKPLISSSTSREYGSLQIFGTMWNDESAQVPSNYEEASRNNASKKTSCIMHDNTLSYVALSSIRPSLASKSIATVEHPPCSPSPDFWLFPNSRLDSKVTDFKTSLTFNHAKTFLRNLTNEDFLGCFDLWKHRMEKYVCAEGEYFEGMSLYFFM